MSIRADLLALVEKFILLCPIRHCSVETKLLANEVLHLCDTCSSRRVRLVATLASGYYLLLGVFSLLCRAQELLTRVDAWSIITRVGQHKPQKLQQTSFPVTALWVRSF
jgi:hypothetical protein